MPIPRQQCGSSWFLVRPEMIRWRTWLRGERLDAVELTGLDQGIGDGEPTGSFQQMSPPPIEQATADAVASRHRNWRYARLQALRRNLALLLDRPTSSPLAARDHLDPLTASAHTTSRRRALCFSNRFNRLVVHRHGQHASHNHRGSNVGSALRLRTKEGDAIARTYGGQRTVGTPHGHVWSNDHQKIRACPPLTSYLCGDADYRSVRCGLCASCASHSAA
jgi:hypothetical protein